MLVLTRKSGERIFINNGEIVITITYHDRHKVRLGIEAPKGMSIDREEIYIKKQEELKAETRRKELMGYTDESDEGETEVQAEEPTTEDRKPYEG